ncbi:MAG TPA: response regulator [Verrucomicrobiae bacterium]
MADSSNQPVSTLKPPAREGATESLLNVADSLNSFRHGLRTPLNQILGYTEMLMEDVSCSSAQALLPDLERVHLIGGQLLALINEGLAPWKLMVGRVDLETMRFEMRSPLNLIIGYTELCQEIAEERGDMRLVPDLKKIIGAAKNLQNAFESPSLKDRVDRCLQSEKSKHRTRWLMEEPPESPQDEGTILIVDDNEMNRDMLCRRLERYGYVTIEAENGKEGLEQAHKRKPDLILMDVVMPNSNGYEYLEKFKNDPALGHIPVIMLSALDEMEVTIRCIEIGAEDYIPKPFNPVLLKARIESSVQKKRLRDQEKALLDMMRMEREHLEQIMNGALPQSAAARIRQGEQGFVDEAVEASVLLVEIVDFKALSAQLPTKQSATVLTEVSMTLDWLARFSKADKIRTNPGQFVIVAGLQGERADHANAVSDIALKLQHVLPLLRMQTKTDLHLRVTMASGTLSGGVIGRASYYYEVWGEALRKATQLMPICEPGSVIVEEQCARKLQNYLKLEPIPGTTASRLIGRSTPATSVAA